MNSVTSFTPGAGRQQMQGKFDVKPATKRLEGVGKRFVREAAGDLLREFSKRMPVDTGMARGWLGLQPVEKGMRYHVGILASAGGEGKMPWYPLYFNYGIYGEQGSRVFLSFFNSDGSPRETVINWAVRHGFKVYSSPKTGGAVKRRPSMHPGYAMRGMLVWGRKEPWFDQGYAAARGRVEKRLRKMKGKL